LSKRRKQQREREREQDDEIAKPRKFRDGVVVSAKTQGQKRYIIEAKNSEITFCTGPAGSGKTCIAIGLALQYLTAAQSGLEKIVIMRPTKEACDERIGYLPGDIDEKMGPWAAPVMDNMLVFLDRTAIKNLMYEHKVEIIPMAYCRGRSLSKACVIVDEAQNLTKAQMLMTLTRLGEGSRMILTGDLEQSDIHGENGLQDAVKRLKEIPGIAFVELTESDIVRHPLIATILQRYTR